MLQESKNIIGYRHMVLCAGLLAARVNMFARMNLSGWHSDKCHDNHDFSSHYDQLKKI